MAGRSTYATCGAILALIAAGAVAPARAEPAADAKESPIEFIVPFGPGGGADQLARRIAPRLSEILGTEVAVTNIPGATGNVGMAKLLNAPADGRKIAVLTGDTLAWLAHLNAGWTPADVVPVAVMMRESSMLFLPTDSRFKSWRELENEASQKPHSLRVAISGLGSPDYIALQQLDAAGIRLLALPFSNPEERYAAVSRGAADALYEQPGDVKELLDTHQLRPVLYFGEKSPSGLKNLPASQELGYGPGVVQFRAIIVKSGTDPATVKRYEEALEKIAAMPDFQAFLANRYVVGDNFMQNSDAHGFIEAELRGMSKIVRGLRLHSRYILDVKSSDHYYVEGF